MSTLKVLMLNLAAAMLVAGCAHRLEPVALAPSADPMKELQSLNNDMATAQSRQIDVLAPDTFRTATKYHSEAKERREENESGNRILEPIGYARAYLNEANKIAEQTRSSLENILVARQNAIKAGAKDLGDHLPEADEDLKWASRRVEKGKAVDVDTLAELHQEYLDLEVAAMKQAKLSQAKNIVSLSEKKGARRLIPRTYSMAVQKVTAAEKIIETDRHNEARVNQYSAEANQAAKHMLTILETALAARDRTPEQVALALDRKNDQLAQESERLREIAGEAMKNRQALGQVQGQVQRLRGEAAITAAMKEAEEKFSKDEAEVYRQGNNVVIRLKKINFPTGKSDLPSDSLDTLRKVKDVLAETNPANVIVEGHTDTTGSASLNKRLSEKRADEVAKYLVEEEAIPEERVRALGYGFEKPLASNKTKMGRSQNRRVDIVIRPEETATTERSTSEQ